MPLRICAPQDFFTVEKIDHRWWLCTPAGNAFWMLGVYNVNIYSSTDDLGVNPAVVVQQKYGDALTWGPRQNRRLKSWGFNAIAEYGSRWVQPTATHSSWPGGLHPVPMPFTGLLYPAWYSLKNTGNHANGPVKDLIRATKTSVYTGYRAYSPDIWDPNFKLWLTNAIQKDFAYNEWLQGPNKEYLIGLNVDDTDKLQGFGAGPDFATVADAVASGGQEQPHLSWLILITPPTQESNVPLGITYSDRTVYSKRELSSFLASRYETVTLLNQAWGSTYTTFGSSGGWGTGTGLLDEDGTHPWVCPDHLRLSGCRAAMRKDLDDFLYHHARKYFSDIKEVLSTYAPGRLYLGPTVLGTWGAPPRRQILQAARDYLDVYMTPTVPAGVVDDQARIDFIYENLGDKPWMSWEGIPANPDSYFYAYPSPRNTVGSAMTQDERGEIYSRRVETLLNAHTSSGTYPVVGLKFWEFMDNWGEKANWGLMTRKDNAYDGREARTDHTLFGSFPGLAESRNYGNFLGCVFEANYKPVDLLVGSVTPGRSNPDSRPRVGSGR